jgi:hypothetical protein
VEETIVTPDEKIGHQCAENALVQCISENAAAQQMTVDPVR